MIRILLIILGLCIYTPSTNAEVIELTSMNVVRVYDGDTITVNLPGQLPVFGTALGVRIRDVNTPELTSTCSTAALKTAEKLKAQQARQLVDDLVSKGRVIVLSDLGRDKYFRLLARVSVDGTDVATRLIESGLADHYTGGTKISWCGR